MTLLDLRDGGHLKYEDSGSGRPIVLLHGWGMRGEFFKAQIAALSTQFRIVVPDLRGHGDSSNLEENQSLSTLVDDVAELLVSLDLSQTMLIGWSMGAMVSWGVMQHQEAGRVSSMVSIDMIPRLLNDDTWKFGLRDGDSASVFSEVVARMLADWPGFTRIFVPRIVARGQHAKRKALVDWVIDKTEKNHPESMAQLWLSMASQDFRSQLAAIETPTLVTYGALSQLYSPAASEWVARQLPNSRRVGFANSGHSPHLEEPDAFNRAIETFAEQTRVESPGGSAIRQENSN